MIIKANLLRNFLLGWALLLAAAAQAQLTFTTNNGAVTITGFTGNPVVLNIPSTTNGFPVISIADSAFSFRYSLTSVTIPSSVTYIGQMAFNWCSNLTSVTIPNSVGSIGSSAFGDCLALTNVTLPNRATNIGAAVFAACPNLKSVIIPSGSTFIEDLMFESTGLTNITIPNSVTNIGDSTFCGCPNLTSITIPNSVTGIKEFAFETCASLKSVYFQGNAPSVGSGAFGGDTNVTLYYLSGTSGWGNFSQLTGASTVASTVLWNPQAQTSDGSFGVRTNQFGFNIAGSSNLVVVVEASTNLSSFNWQPVQTNTLTTGSAYFSDPQWTKFHSRFYRLRSP